MDNNIDQTMDQTDTPKESETSKNEEKKEGKLRKRSNYEKAISLLKITKALIRQMHEETNIDKFLKLVLKGVHETIGFDRVRIYLVSDDGSELLGKAAVNVPNFSKFHTEIKEDKVIKNIFGKKRAGIYTTYEGDPFAEQLGKTVGKTKFVAMPLTTKKETIGMITADNILSGRNITRAMLNSLTFFADIASSAIENAELYQNMEKLVRQRTKELENANEKLMTLDKQKDQFLNYVSHELRTPMTSILGYSKLIKDGKIPETNIRDSIGVIYNESNRLVNMINNLLDLSRIRAGKLFMRREKSDILEVITSSILVAKNQAEERNIRIEHNLSAFGDNPLYSFIDKGMIKQILLNLLSNAIKFSEDNSKIDIDVKEDDGKIFVSVTDYGQGIPEDKQNQIFKEFHQVFENISSSGSSGLGLVISKKIAEMHGGKIHFESKEKEKTTFMLELECFNDS